VTSKNYGDTSVILRAVQPSHVPAGNDFFMALATVTASSRELKVAGPAEMGSGAALAGALVEVPW